MEKLLEKIKQKVHLTVSLTLVLFFLLFILQNIEQTQATFLFWTISLPRAIMLLSTLLLGVIIGIISMIGKASQEKTSHLPENITEKSALEKKITGQEVELTKLYSELNNAKQILLTHEANYRNTQEQLTENSKLQNGTEKELSTTKNALSGAYKTISSLEREITQLQGQIETKELVDRIIQHDLRGAISASVSLPEAILDDTNLDDNQKLIVTLIRDSGRKMLETLDSSLIIYRIEEGTYNKEFINVNIHNIITMVTDRIREILLNSNQEVLISCMGHDDQDDSAFIVYGDEFLLFNTFMNLIMNASEASPPGKPISIVLSQNDYCSIAIRNYGEVPASIRDTFFNKMVTSGKKFGTGLGTYSAMLMVKAQGGDIELDCSEPGMTTIYVSLPIIQE